jgi:hypothetical protein
MNITYNGPVSEKTQKDIGGGSAAGSAGDRAKGGSSQVACIDKIRSGEKVLDFSELYMLFIFPLQHQYYHH